MNNTYNYFCVSFFFKDNNYNNFVHYFKIIIKFEIKILTIGHNFSMSIRIIIIIIKT